MLRAPTPRNYLAPFRRGAPTGMTPGMTRLSVRLDLAEGRIGPGKLALMEAIQTHGSVSAAARALGMSYRRAWTLTEAINALAASPLIEKSAGGASRGGAVLTPLGREALRLCRSAMEKAEAAGAPDIARLDALLKDGGAG